MAIHKLVVQPLFLSFLLLFLFSNLVSASLLSKLNLRILVSNPNNDSNFLQVSPSPTPVPLQLPDNTTQDSANDNQSNSVTETSGGNEKKDNDEVKGDSDGRNCSGVSRRCKDQKSLLACILDYQSGSKEILVLVQNDGEKNLSVDLSGSNHRDDALLEIPKHGSKQIKLLVGNEPVILRAGNGACILHPDVPVSEGNFFLNLPSYDQLITPINGAYFLIVTVIVFGGTCAFCSFRKRRRPDGVAYQELEMSVPETGAVNNEESTDGWDQSWDDDWDEENAVKSPAARRAGSISADGLTSRTTNKDGWENDWDN